LELTEREQEVLYQICQGKSYSDIGDALFISQNTVRSHIKKLYKKLKVHSKSQAIIMAFKKEL
jgi:DNA-binding CsgD family transcriptional regulator